MRAFNPKLGEIVPVLNFFSALFVDWRPLSARQLKGQGGPLCAAHRFRLAALCLFVDWPLIFTPLPNSDHCAGVNSRGAMAPVFFLLGRFWRGFGYGWHFDPIVTIYGIFGIKFIDGNKGTKLYIKSIYGVVGLLRRHLLLKLMRLLITTENMFVWDPCLVQCLCIYI